MYRLASVLIFLFSNFAFGQSCIPSSDEGYWVAEGSPGIIEMWLLDTGKAGAMYQQKNEHSEIEVVEVVGSWGCSDIGVVANFTEFQVLFEIGDTAYTLKTHENKNGKFSNRVFEFSGY